MSRFKFLYRIQGSCFISVRFSSKIFQSYTVFTMVLSICVVILKSDIALWNGRSFENVYYRNSLFWKRLPKKPIWKKIHFEKLLFKGKKRSFPGMSSFCGEWKVIRTLVCFLRISIKYSCPHILVQINCSKSRCPEKFSTFINTFRRVNLLAGRLFNIV